MRQNSLYYIAIITDASSNQFYFSSSEDIVLYNGFECSPILEVQNVDQINIISSGSNHSFWVNLLDKNVSVNFDGAKIEILTGDLSLNTLPGSIFKGLILSATKTTGLICLELKPLSCFLLQGIGNFFSPLCRATLGDGQCRVDVSSFTFLGKITTVVNQRNFIGDHTVHVPGFFLNGIVMFTMQNNFKTTIVNDGGGQINFLMSPPRDIQVGDSYMLIAGCDKSHTTCAVKFRNIVNFRGEPFI